MGLKYTCFNTVVPRLGGAGRVPSGNFQASEEGLQLQPNAGATRRGSKTDGPFFQRTAKIRPREKSPQAAALSYRYHRRHQRSLVCRKNGCIVLLL